jgi:tetratricopeptide (TPR) repeat protein
MPQQVPEICSLYRIRTNKYMFNKLFLSAAGFLAIVLLFMIAAFNKPVRTNERNRPGNKVAIFCAPSFDRAKMNEPGSPLFKGLGNLHWPVSTASAPAQQYFDQGITLIYAFNHGEAGRSFSEVIRLDTTCAMAYWGLGMVLGPNYNAALDPSALSEIQNVVNKALKYSARASAREKVLIHALAKRFPPAAVKDMTPFNAAYAKAMQEAYEQFPGDLNIAVLYADALMNEHPWNLWLKDGAAQPWTPAIVQLLENILEKDPRHPGANHLYIHAMEASRTAGKAMPSADRLRTMLPAAGHMLHMPSHIDIRTGQYHKGVVANEKASEADSSYIAQCKREGFYPLLLYPHNIHFLAACAFFEGNSKKALDAAWMVSRKADRKYLAELGTVQHYYIIPFYVMVQLGKWDDILALAMPGESLKYPQAIWHYARGMAYASKNNMQQAAHELEELQKQAADGSLSSLLVWDMNSVSDLIHIAAYTLEATIAANHKQFDKAIALAGKAVDIEDKLAYTEPPDWFFSVRHTLGYILVQSKKFAEAEQVYLQDLATYPENGWALIGLYNSLYGQGKTAEAAAVKKRFDKAWQWADIKITTSRVL